MKPSAGKQDSSSSSSDDELQRQKYEAEELAIRAKVNELMAQERERRRKCKEELKRYAEKKEAERRWSEKEADEEDGTDPVPPELPESAGSIKLGAKVILEGLSGRPELNGEVGMARKYDAEKERWVVRLATAGRELLLLKAANLQPTPTYYGLKSLRVPWADDLVDIAAAMMAAAPTTSPATNAPAPDAPATDDAANASADA